MKTIILLCTVLVLTTGAWAQKSQSIKSGVMKKGGSVWLIKPMEENEKMDNGVTVKVNGTVEKKSGKTVTLNNGDCLDKHGELVALNDKGVKSALIKNGKMWKATRVSKALVLSDGTKISVNGTVKKSDGSTIVLKNDEIVALAGTE